MRAEEDDSGSARVSPSYASSTGFLRRVPVLRDLKGSRRRDISFHSFGHHDFSQGQIPF